ncbi:MAG: pentapeptide repeat-containing protein [Symploca sp. SIO2G7]|nr:pentapeptide repeat-containing protein [Symploca sp. SIO2G7]
MRASEVLRAYKDGRRDFRSQSFMGMNLAGADFREADIRGANFTNAYLRGAKFCGAKAGLPEGWAVFLVAVSWLLSALSGFFSWWISAAVSWVFSPGDTGFFIAGIVSLIALAAFFIVTIRKSLAAGALAVAVAGVVAGAGALAVALAVALTVAGAGVAAGAFAVKVAGALAVAGAGAVAGAVAAAIAVALAGVAAGVAAVAVAVAVAIAVARAGAGAVAGAVALTLAGAVALAVAVVLLGAYLGWCSLKGDERDAWIRSVAIAFAATGGTSFRNADLTDADFTGARLNSTDLRRAILTRTRWRDTKKLDCTRAGGTILSNAAVRDLLVTGNGYKKSYEKLNLRGASLKSANLNYANLKYADFSEANLQEANLERVNLTEANVVEADFTGALLTGACIGSWNIDSSTKLEQVDCRFVYLLENCKPKTDNRERRPSSGDFQPGEFTKLFQEVLNTVDLIFRNGVDWKAFVDAFEKLQVENDGAELTIRNIENKGDGVVVIKVNVPTDANKEKIHSEFTQNYELSLKAVEEKYQAKLESKDEVINHCRQQSADMWLTINKLADKQPITIEVKNTAESKTMIESTEKQTKNVEVEMIFQKEVTGAIGKVEGDMFVNPKQSLADSAAEIRQLLQILDQSYPSTLPADTQAEIDVAVKGIAKNPDLKGRVVAALKAGGIEALKELADNLYVNILVAAYEGWRNPQK